MVLVFFNFDCDSVTKLAYFKIVLGTNLLTNYPKYWVTFLGSRVVIYGRRAFLKLRSGESTLELARIH